MKTHRTVVASTGGGSGLPGVDRAFVTGLLTDVADVRSTGGGRKIDGTTDLTADMTFSDHGKPATITKPTGSAVNAPDPVRQMFQ